MLEILIQIFNEFIYTLLRKLPFVRKPLSRNYLIIGASSGIGRSLVHSLAKHSKSRNIGIAIASRKIDDLNALKKEIQDVYPNVSVSVRKYDLTHFNDAEPLLEDVHKSLGTIDTIVVNGGISDIHELGDEDYFKRAKPVLETNLMGPIAIISAFVKYAKREKVFNPYIVTVSSISSSRVYYFKLATASNCFLRYLKKRIGLFY
eukprot:NODE_20_length_44879_cov_0.624654.p28 type:complete len:204 gc:universal NODE_20_length_44879_cov_0.624654:18104-17493(-)